MGRSVRLGGGQAKHIPLVAAPRPVQIKEVGITRGTLNRDRASTHLAFVKGKQKAGNRGWGWVAG